MQTVRKLIRYQETRILEIVDHNNSSFVERDMGGGVGRGVGQRNATREPTRTPTPELSTTATRTMEVPGSRARDEHRQGGSPSGGCPSNRGGRRTACMVAPRLRRPLRWTLRDSLRFARMASPFLTALQETLRSHGSHQLVDFVTRSCLFPCATLSAPPPVSPSRTSLMSTPKMSKRSVWEKVR